MAVARSQEGRLTETPLLATLGLIWGVLGATAAAFGLVLYLIDPKAVPLAIGNLVFALSGLVFYALTNRAAIARIAAGRSTALMLLEGLLVAGVVAGAVAANYYASRSTIEWDLTRDQLFTLQEQSVRVATALKKPVKVIGFYKAMDGARPRLERLVDLYRRHTDRITVELMNPDTATPALVRQYKLARDSARIVVVAEDGRQTKIKNPVEEELTNALVQVSEQAARKIYFLTGHGEPSIEDVDAEGGYARATQGLVDQGYEVAPLSLVDKDRVADDAAVVIAAGQKTAVFQNEVDALRDYVGHGGRLLVMLDPGVESGLGPLLNAYGVEVGDNLVVDPNAASKALGFGADAPVITSYEPHAITDPLKGSALLLYWTRSVAPKIGVPDVIVTTLIRTGASSWGETRYREGGDVEQDEDDVPGPVPVAVAAKRTTSAVAEKRTDEARVIALGDSSYATNRFYPMGGNGELLLNCAAWLAGDEQRITIRPRSRSASSIPLTEEQQYGIVFFSVNLVPLLIVGIGFSVWAVRRRK